MERVPGSLDPAEDDPGGVAPQGRFLAATQHHDDIWETLPEDRRLDRRAFDFAIETVAAIEGASPQVLDLGCGDGCLAAELAAGGVRVTGVDSSRVALERARRAHPELELVVPTDDGRLPFADGAFDAIVCINVLQYVADTQTLLSEARRVLVASGALVVAVPWHGRLKNLLIALGSFERHHDPLEPVLRFYTPRSLRRLLEDFGFDWIRLEGAGGMPLLRETLLGEARRASITAA